jgi:multidrug efflux pump subunit AcrB
MLQQTSGVGKLFSRRCLRTPTDIFPNINIPVIAVAWQFTGLNPEELEGRLTTGFERVLTTTVDNI